MAVKAAENLQNIYIPTMDQAEEGKAPTSC